MWPRTAEIIHHRPAAGWKPEDVQAFSTMLTKINLPLIKDGSGANGNWELSMIEGMMGIAVFTDDRALLNHAEAMWRERVPAYFYNATLDGDHPKPLPLGASRTGWYGQTTFDCEHQRRGAGNLPRPGTYRLRHLCHHGCGGDCAYTRR